MARRKVKNGEKSPWGQCLTRPVPNGRRRSGFWLVPEKHKFSGTNQKPEWRRPFGTGLVRHCPQGLFSPFFTFLRAIFFRPFRLSLAPNICPWVSEDDIAQDVLKTSVVSGNQGFTSSSGPFSRLQSNSRANSQQWSGSSYRNQVQLKPAGLQQT